jgi:hypothetical protein
MGIAGCSRVEVDFVSSQRVDLLGLRGTLGTARCAAAPDAREGPLRRADVERAGCRTRPYSGSLTVHALEPDGSRGTAIQRISVVDGAFEVSFAQLASRSDAAIFLLGPDAWAGAVRLPVQPRRRAHLDAVASGRGSPGLLVAVQDPALRTAESWALTAEAKLARQEQDYLQVARGTLAPGRFLTRHPWSPFRESVLGMLERPPREAAPADPADPAERPVETARAGVPPGQQN